nr:unnamed protein product [Callosobruchus analis]
MTVIDLCLPVPENFPHCLGAVDGKHCMIQAPINSGNYFNYKQYFSIVLLGMADANYCPIFAEVGCQGRTSDVGVLRNSLLGHKLQNNQLNLPPARALENRTMEVPFVFIGDDAFSLHDNLFKAYPVELKERIHQAVCRARRVIENVFGIISAVFRVLRKPMFLLPEKSTKVILACIYLHSFLRKSRESRNVYTPPGTFDEYQEEKIIPGAWRQQNDELQSFLPLQKVPRSAAHCEAIRNEFDEYFSNEGSVTWQHKYVISM